MLNVQGPPVACLLNILHFADQNHHFFAKISLPHDGRELDSPSMEDLRFPGGVKVLWNVEHVGERGFICFLCLRHFYQVSAYVKPARELFLRTPLSEL